MDSIGGYFELELPPSGQSWHPEALAFSTGRACLAAVLDEVCPKTVFLPAYICDGIKRPIRAVGISIESYEIGADFLPRVLPDVGPEDLFIFVNYFGFLGLEAERLALMLGDRLVVDNNQAFFCRRVPEAWSFNTARKFFGVPDGAYLYSPRLMAAPSPRNTRYSTDHLMARLEGRAENGLGKFRESEALLGTGQPGMSRLSERILASINYERVAAVRKRNFEYLHSRLSPHNRIHAVVDSTSVPLCYPFLPKRSFDRRELFEERIFVPQFWEEVTDIQGRRYGWERDLADRLCPLPVDQRYGEPEMERVSKTVLGLLRRG